MLSMLLALTIAAGDALNRSQVDLPQADRPQWIFFVDRPSAGHIDPSATLLTERALARRSARGAGNGSNGVDARDLPVDPGHLAALRSAGAEIRTTSRWLHAASVVATPEELRRIDALPFVKSIQPVRRATRPAFEESAAPPSGGMAEGGIAGALDYGASGPQIAQIDLTALHDRGMTGAGIVIGILDTGFNREHEAFNQPGHEVQVLAEYDFINDDPFTGIEEGDPEAQHRHGTWVLGTIGAWLPGQLVGAAPDAAFVLAKTEVVTSETQIEEDYYVAGLEFIEAQGADLATSSLGYFDWYQQSDLDGQTAVTTIAVNIATANGLVCLTAAGNGGHDEDSATSQLGAPADAFDVITCGAVDATGESAGFTSDGPTADGRVKPELLALGVAVSTVKSTGPTGLSALNGTSFATPLTAGAVACVLQARRDLTVASLRNALVSTASENVGVGGPDPLFIRGYGLVQANSATLHGLDPADVNQDGAVNGADLGVVLSEWGPCLGCSSDITGDGVTDGGDLGAVLAAWTG